MILCVHCRRPARRTEDERPYLPCNCVGFGEVFDGRYMWDTEQKKTLEQLRPQEPLPLFDVDPF